MTYAVRYAYRAVVDHGDNVSDGIFGHQTLAATREFQSSHDLRVTGKADPGTLRVLQALAPEPGSLPVAALLLTTAIMGTALLGRRFLT